jgi:SAM-dependent methyltransferase
MSSPRLRSLKTYNRFRTPLAINLWLSLWIRGDSFLLASPPLSPPSVPVRRRPVVPSTSLCSLSGDDEARSAFGTKEYWDEVYLGRGDFPADEYTWYFGFDAYQRIVQEYVDDKTLPILIPGIGNDPILLALLQKGYTNLTATDYSEHAIERQIDLLSYQYADDTVELRCMDARDMDATWTNKFSGILEKGALDAIYLSGDGNLELTVSEFERILTPGGILISISGVVPEELRRHVFQNWEWLKDGSDDLKAGCFVLRHR